MKCKFLGKPDKMFPTLKTGMVYDLAITTERYGFLWMNERPIIISPFMCPYSSWITFYRNWQPI